MYLCRASVSRATVGAPRANVGRYTAWYTIRYDMCCCSHAMGRTRAGVHMLSLISSCIASRPALHRVSWLGWGGGEGGVTSLGCVL